MYMQNLNPLLIKKIPIIIIFIKISHTHTTMADLVTSWLAGAVEWAGPVDSREVPKDA